ncbi:MAG TPA: alcohol dehydrogenase catalytic domain-containing protein [Phycisphaerae bacterium]|nr:alcohol dehydrogenase catalytic domain-containing protein [Phycisphaerae bacterium]
MQALTFDIRPWRWVACRVLGIVARGVYFSALSGLRLRNLPEPELPGPQWVRLRTLLGGICGTDLGLILQRSHPASLLRSFTSFPVVLGHENVAVIDRVGAAVTGYAVGDRVCVEPSLSCAVRGITPLCGQCQAGLFSLCDGFLDGDLPPGTMIGLNAFTGGSWAPYFIAHVSQLHRVPDAVDDAAAVLVDPLACSLHGVLRCSPSDDQRVLVQGGGIIGIGVVAALRALDCHALVTALVRRPHQAQMMRSFGASDVILSPANESSAERYDRVAAAVAGRRVPAGFGNQALIGGFDVVYDCVGTGAGLTDAMKFARSRGTVVALGTCGISIVDTTPLWFNEVTVLGGYGRQIENAAGEPARHTYRLVLDLMGAGKLPTDGLLTHTFALPDYRAALRTAASRGRVPAVKVAFRHESS